MEESIYILTQKDIFSEKNLQRMIPLIFKKKSEHRELLIVVPSDKWDSGMRKWDKLSLRSHLYFTTL